MSVKKSVNALEFCKSALSCYSTDGGIVPAFQSEKIHDGYPEGAFFSAYSNAIDGFIVCTQKEIYTSENETDFKCVTYFNYAYKPFMVERQTDKGGEAIIIASESAVVLSANGYYRIELGALLSCGVIHCGRLFGADAYDKFTLKWSAADSLNDWSTGLNGGGYLRLDPQRGEIEDLLIFNGKIVAVREYGLTVLSMYGSPVNFSVDFTDTDCDKIFKDTARITCGKLYFYSVTGLKCFDGNKLISINSALFEMAYGSAVLGDKYFISGFSNDIGTDAIFCYDVSSGKGCTVKEYAETIFARNKIYCSSGTIMYTLKEGGWYTFESSPIDFGTGRMKTVTKIDVLGRADVTIDNGRHIRRFNSLSGAVHPHMRGKSFTFFIEGDSAINSVTVTAEVSDAI